MAGPVVAEVIIGISRDETFGLNLLVGSGGTLVEIVDDTVSLLLPLHREEIVSAIKSLKLGVLMDAYRGGKSGDFGALVDAVVAVAEYAVANNDTLIELDVNPLIVQPVGAVAVDGLIRKRA
jgi:acetyl-CoA synthetase